MASCGKCCPSPRLAQCPMAYSCSKGKKRTQDGHPAFPALQDASQEAYSGLTSWGPLRESEEFDHGGSARDGDRDRFTATTFRAGWIKFLLVAVPKQRYQHVVLPICRAEPLAPSGQGAWLSVLPDLDPKPYQHEPHSMALPGHGSRFTVLPNC